ncbi:oligosaccharide flippase family protein [Streptococcus phocae subsp. salmonis]|uniref:oligosaccharide flippase family protein n=1 Tax=Streptococcus phocae TaxID=119224 RepID=UPI000530EBED|nr:oligosaccharide flippase family protein [Streptococcus phocae]KGR72494.1 polysaccharide biosynthesis protein [Streptococcus phocae subsp. salmonis]
MKLNSENVQNHAKTSSILIIVSGLLSKILAAIYRIPYQNLVGDRGFYAYQQIYPLLAIISSLSLIAFPNLISSLAQKRNPLQLITLFKVQLLMCWSLSGVLLMGHEIFANVMGAPQLKIALLITAITLIPVPFISFYRGLAQADYQMLPTAISQVIEQLIRVSIIIAAALCYRIFNWDIYVTANLAASGNLLASLVILGYLKVTSPYQLWSYVQKGHFALKDIKDLGLSPLIFILFSIYLLVFQLIDSLFVKNGLVTFGYSNTIAEAIKGGYDRGQPLIQFGLLFSTALFTAYLPKLTALYHDKHSLYLKESEIFFAFIFYFNATLTLGFISVLRVMNKVLFGDTKYLWALMVYVMVIFISSMIQFFHHKCFIEHQVKKSLNILVLGLLAKLFLTPLLTVYFSITGSSLSTLISLGLVYYLYSSFTGASIKELISWKYVLTLCAMLLIVYVSQSLLPSKGRLDSLFSLLVSASLGLLSFLVLSKQLGVFSSKLWSFLPFTK